MSDAAARRNEAVLAAHPGDQEALRALVAERSRAGLDLAAQEEVVRRLRASELRHEDRLEVLLHGLGIAFSRKVIRLPRESFPEYQFEVGRFSFGAQFRDGRLAELEAFGPGPTPADAAWSHVSFRHLVRVLSAPESVWPLDGASEAERRAAFLGEAAKLGLVITAVSDRRVGWPGSGGPGGFAFTRSGLEFSADWGPDDRDDGLVYVRAWPTFIGKNWQLGGGLGDKLLTPDGGELIFMPGDLVEAVDGCLAVWGAGLQRTRLEFMACFFELGFRPDREGPWFYEKSEGVWQGRISVPALSLEPARPDEAADAPTPRILLDQIHGLIEARIRFPDWVRKVLGDDEHARVYRTPRELFTRLAAIYRA